MLTSGVFVVADFDGNGDLGDEGGGGGRLLSPLIFFLGRGVRLWTATGDGLLLGLASESDDDSSLLLL